MGSAPAVIPARLLWSPTPSQMGLSETDSRPVLDYMPTIRLRNTRSKLPCPPRGVQWEPKSRAYARYGSGSRAGAHPFLPARIAAESICAVSGQLAYDPSTPGAGACTARALTQGKTGGVHRGLATDRTGHRRPERAEL